MTSKELVLKYIFDVEDGGEFTTKRLVARSACTLTYRTTIFNLKKLENDGIVETLPVPNLSHARKYRIISVDAMRK